MVGYTNIQLLKQMQGAHFNFVPFVGNVELYLKPL